MRMSYIINIPYNQQASSKSLDSAIKKKIRSQVVLDNERLLICWNTS